MKNNELLGALRSGDTDDISPRSRAEAIAIAIHQKIKGTDVSADTVTAETLLEGVTAYNSDGKRIKGIHVCKDQSIVITDFSYFCYDHRRLDAIKHMYTSKGTNFSHMFFVCDARTSIPELDTSNGTDFSYMFYGCDALTSIPELDTSKGTNFIYMFFRCTSLKDITFTGTINTGGMDLSHSKSLTKASITSLVNALSSTVSGRTVTVSQTAVNNAFATDEWEALKATKSNWTIKLKDSN